VWVYVGVDVDVGGYVICVSVCVCGYVWACVWVFKLACVGVGGWVSELACVAVGGAGARTCVCLCAFWCRAAVHVC